MGHLLTIARQRQVGLLEPELRELIGRVAAYFKCSSGEVALALEIAAIDPEAARESFEDDARRGWLV